MPGEMQLRIWDVEHGACAMVQHVTNGQGGRLAVIDSGCTADWHPSTYIRHTLGRTALDYLIITNADQDHLSDLAGLAAKGVYVKTFYRNRHPPPNVLRTMKQQCGGVTDDMEQYLALHTGYTADVSEPFNLHMGGITLQTFGNPYPLFQNTNDLSLVAVLQYGAFKIVFPGDLEAAGWLALLQKPDFCAALRGVNVFVASHHGRENGYCEEVFAHCHPQAVVMSDKSIMHDTQLMAPVYRQRVLDHENGVFVTTTNKRRHVLTTRRDGTILFRVNDNNYTVQTEKQG
jgi:beta-lactamase superfamily II metal-dependent hydrolase